MGSQMALLAMRPKWSIDVAATCLRCTLDQISCVQGLQGQGTSTLQKLLPQEMSLSLDLRMGSHIPLLAIHLD